MPGGSSIVDANGWDASKGYAVDWAPSMRMVVNLGDLDASRWVNQTGNSGHPYDANYVDQADAWVKNETYPWPFSQKAVRDGGGDELTLIPDASGN
jgi:penicillin amidase